MSEASMNKKDAVHVFSQTLKSDQESMGQEVIDLATVVRPFLMGKRGQVAMSTLALLVAEAMMNLTDMKFQQNTLDLFNNSVEAYIEEITRIMQARESDD
jgi:hypothetical protein